MSDNEKYFAQVMVRTNYSHQCSYPGNVKHMFMLDSMVTLSWMPQVSIFKRECCCSNICRLYNSLIDFILFKGNVISLFKERGWDAIITDDLVDNVLVLISLGAGLITGAIAAFLSWVLDLHVEDGAFL